MSPRTAGVTRQTGRLQSAAAALRTITDAHKDGGEKGARCFIGESGGGGVCLPRLY